MRRADQIESILNNVDGVPAVAKLPKHLKMASSPYLFFRGSAALMYHDFKSNHIALPEQLFTLPLTNIVGDCHTGNFGFISEEGSHGDTLIFAPNDFDDACIGHAVWDIFRLVTSLYLAHDHAKREQAKSDDVKVRQKPLVAQEQLDIAARQLISSYLSACERSLSHEINSQSALTHFDKEHILHKRWQKALQRKAGGAAFLTNSTLAKELDLATFPLRFKQNPERFESLSPAVFEDIVSTFSPYVDDTILDCVERLNAGTGSNNMKRYYLLVGPEVNSETELDLSLCHIVEVKQQRTAAPLAFYPNLSPVNQLNAAHLTVNCQRKMQRRPDLVLDDAFWLDKHWLIRSRHHARVGIAPEDILLGKRAALKNGFTQFADSCGFALALTHMRGDRRSLLFQQACLDTLPSYVNTIIASSRQYAEQVQTDCNLLAQMLADS